LDEGRGETVLNFLENGERVDNHDKVCADYYSSLLALGMYDEELALFGVAYIREGKSKCFISPSRNKVVEFVNACREQHIYPTTIEGKIKRIRIHSGEKEKVEKEFKLEFAKLLREHYSDAFLKDLQKIAQCPIYNKAADILNPLRDNLEGCFDEGALQLFRGAVEFAYDGKILTAADYQENKLWIKRESEFLTERTRKASNFRRMMTGFAYIDGKKIKYYTTALEERTLEKRLQLISEKKIVSPVYAAEYCFNSYADLAKGIQWFDKVVEERIDTNYMELIRDLYRLKPEIEEHEFAKLEEKYAANQYMKKTLAYYKTLWHLV